MPCFNFRRDRVDYEIPVVLNTEEENKGSRIRILVAFICFLGNTVNYMTRVNLSVAIVAMTFDEKGDRPVGAIDVPIYSWDTTIRGIILSSFFWGYLLSSAPSGYIVQRFGIRIPLFICLLLNSVFTILFVPAASLGWGWACATRVLLGVVQGPLNPTYVYLVSNWSPPKERSRTTMCMCAGNMFGAVLGMACSGLLSSWGGWPWVFYMGGILSCFLAFIWVWLIADSPAEHRLITPRERNFIQNEIAEDGGQKPSSNKQVLKTPWCAIFTSPAVLALIVADCSFNWGMNTLLTQVPSYMSYILHFNLTTNGFLSAAPMVSMFLFGIVFSFIADLLLQQKCYSVGTSRRIWNSIAYYGGAIALIVLGYESEDHNAAIAILIVAMTLNSGAVIGYQVNYVDVSPNFASTISGISGTFSNIFSLLAPLVSGFIVTQDNDAGQWRIVFLLAAGIYIVGNTFYIVFGSGEIQPWNNPTLTKTQEDGREEFYLKW